MDSSLAEKLKIHEDMVSGSSVQKELKRIQSESIKETIIDDDFIPPPEPTQDMFYGIVGKVAATAAEGTEVNIVAAATVFLSFLGANVGRDTFLYIANTYHHPRLFTIHIGRSGRGRKGDSMQLTLRIRQHIESLDKKLLGQLHTGGLSSKEGLASLIQDAHGDKSGVDDKRLLVIESELANVLHQFKVQGNSLSVGLRQAWDGGDISPATKNGRTWATSPHIGIHANITPAELTGLMSTREMTNGFANRFLMIFAEKNKQIAFPSATPAHIVEALALEVMDIISFAKGKYPDVQNSQEMNLSAEAVSYYEKIYPVLDAPLASEFITGLLERRAPYALRLAMLFALIDKTRVIEKKHLVSALAWVNYAVDSVKYVFQDQARKNNDDEVRRNADKIVAFLDKNQKGSTATAITNECFKKNGNGTDINKALNYLLTVIPKKIERIEVKKSGRGRNPVLYKLKKGTEETEEFESQKRRGFEVVL